MVRKIWSKNKWLRRGIYAVGILVSIVVLTAVATFAATNIWPNLGARGVDIARNIFGDKTVADVENLLLTAEDKLKKTEYKVAGKSPTPPWKASSLANGSQGSLLPVTAENVPSQPNAGQPWVLADVHPLGDLSGEGKWTPYIWDAKGNVLAYRTYLQPDPQRPYALVAVAAFNLQATQLHFVLGYDEPKSNVYISRPARIPASDMVSGRILAAFNGGFKAQHGHFGVMLNGVTLIPPRDGFGTVGIYSDGTVKVGAWRTDIQPSPQLIAYRQNGPLIVQYGQINPLTARTDPQDWGYTTYGLTATGRSSLGISQDGKVLYYSAGFDLTLPALARAVQDTGAWQAMQLDINNYYVQFEAIRFYADQQPRAVTLIDQMKGPGDHRYLTIESRDFFYITSK